MEGPQDPTEGCRKWTLSKWINLIHRIMFNRQKHTGQCTIICYQKSYYLFVLPFRKLIVKGLFSSHKDRTTVVSFILPGYGRKLFLLCMFCPKRHLESCTWYSDSSPLLRSKTSYTLTGWYLHSYFKWLGKSKIDLTLDKIYKSALLFSGNWQNYFPWKEDGRNGVWFGITTAFHSFSS